ncbi:Abi-alpha family protein [Pleionea litopenaei]|uniref:Abi-alpha family protein n=1 Tax=Pleionea litopenaei TaxID=3070815 RepID=A0AA51RUK3_9GAMM|nr:Abi-alpha family protein [Pleionea sp. HL-JVS1]WMS87901.1 Abi-alpha family protein [Pleionea sp. HL-JVS1]
MKEESKAIQELAKTASKGIEASEKLGGFLSKVLGDGFVELGSAFSDWAKAYRYKNLLKLSDEIEQIHAERKLMGKAINILPKHALPILQEASLEDDDDVRSLWAGLIANATDPNVRFQIKKLYLEILSSLDPIDTVILICLQKLETEEKYSFISGNQLNSEEISRLVGKEEEDVKLSLSSLFRHGLIIDSWEQTIDSMDRGYSGFRVNNPKSNYRLSHLGTTLLDGCKTN